MSLSTNNHCNKNLASFTLFYAFYDVLDLKFRSLSAMLGPYVLDVFSGQIKYIDELEKDRVHGLHKKSSEQK